MSFPCKIPIFPVFTDFNRAFWVQNILIQGEGVYPVGTPKTQIWVLNSGGLFSRGGGLIVVKGTVFSFNTSPTNT